MEFSLNSKEITKNAELIFSKYKLCDHCLGRNFAKIEHGLSNQKRGERLRKKLKIEKKINSDDCCLCNGLFDEIPHFVDIISKSLKKYEFDTFLIGSIIDEDIINKEKEIFEITECKFSESIKSEINREIGKLLEKKINKEVEFKNPTIMVIIDTAFDDIKLQIKSLYIYGRYKKIKRGIPQTRWFCRVCHGKGCKKCDFSGEMYSTSVEGLVSEQFLIETKSDDESFHGCGREDIDVRMLGNGRPFVLEIKNPVVRRIDLSKIQSRSNKKNKAKLEVSDLVFCDKSDIVRLKQADFRKVYRVVFNCERPINSEKLKKAAQSLLDSKISQLTPSRVAHRRADLVREKQVYSCKVESLDGTIVTLTLETESGTYIKELVSGDNQRTKPNLSELLGVPCEVIELDVIEIKGE